ncbi:hypothetical protein HNR46_002975 [Haloferula luteola]|uniref:DUF2271 domain-containing protein n=1 Tax=Haloferula luteola TaxID=595692 RepID=A0A840V348_9BACT|nr:DUF2271 domain-containing protein [Haloferula luteola]MBB5352727.1 hypothetical protein [Haloferula luteola]
MKRLLLLLPAAAGAADLEISIEIPRLQVAEYHRPYVAAWIEKPDRSVAANLTVWYDTGMKDQEGEKWLKDLRQWWRKSGRKLDLPIDGLSSPTRPAGKHPVPLDTLELPALSEGQYTLVVEASREVGGREMVRIPFAWDGAQAVEQKSTGKSELGEVTFALRPTP